LVTATEQTKGNTQFDRKKICCNAKADRPCEVSLVDIAKLWLVWAGVVRNVLQCGRNERGGRCEIEGLRRRVEDSVCIMTR
jgi:hypothetical protein